MIFPTGLYRSIPSAYDTLILSYPSLVSYWPLSGGSPVDIKAANHGTPSNVTFYAPKLINSGDTSISLVGTGSVTVPAATNLDLRTNFSIEAWSSITSTAGAGIIEKTIGGVNNTQMAVIV